MLLCPANVSEGRSPDVLAALVAAAGDDLLDVHTDPHHHRSVLTLVGEDAPRRLATAAVAAIDLIAHAGVHPRLGALDVVPFVPWDGAAMTDAVAARDRFLAWAAEELDLPGFAYGPGPTDRSLPDIRRLAFRSLAPDAGPARPHVGAGAVAVGARGPLVAYNVWLATATLEEAQAVARAVRGPGIRALGLRVGDRVQLSMNLVAPGHVGPAEAYDRVAVLATPAGAELVGLVPRAVLDAVPEERWAELDLGIERTIEWRLARRRERTG